MTRLWVQKAEDDYRGADRLAREDPPCHDLVCFHCQQAAEKYLKALLEEWGLPVPRTHDLIDLLALLPAPGNPLRPLSRGLKFLTNFAVAARYPTVRTTSRKAAAARRWAGKVRAACRGMLGLRTDGS